MLVLSFAKLAMCVTCLHLVNMFSAEILETLAVFLTRYKFSQGAALSATSVSIF